MSVKSQHLRDATSNCRQAVPVPIKRLRGFAGNHAMTIGGGSGRIPVSSFTKVHMQPKLRVSIPRDTSEREAGRVAERVIGNPGQLSRAQFLARADPDVASPGATIQRQAKSDSKLSAPPDWTVEELKEMLNACDGGLDIWAKAKKANKGTDPTIQLGISGGSKGGIIILDKRRDKCGAVQQLIQELTNVSRLGERNMILVSAFAGELSRDDFIKEIERIEYEFGVKNVLTAFDACLDKWLCKGKSVAEAARSVKDFDDYFKNVLNPKHKEGYGRVWDVYFKTKYEQPKQPK